jgi:hypothetical protein
VRDWHAWHAEYDDPASSLSRRLVEVRARLASALADGAGPIRLLSLCAGDGRDTVPVVASSTRDVDACLVELDRDLAGAARQAATGVGSTIEVRTGDAGLVATFADRLPVDVLLLCGVFGNVPDADVETTVTAARSMLSSGGTVIWTRGNRTAADPTRHAGDPADRVRALFVAAGFEEVAFVRPDDAPYRVGVARSPEHLAERLPSRLFSFGR